MANQELTPGQKAAATRAANKEAADSAAFDASVEQARSEATETDSEVNPVVVDAAVVDSIVDPEVEVELEVDGIVDSEIEVSELPEIPEQEDVITNRSPDSPVKLIAVKNALNNAVTGDRYNTSTPTVCSNGIQHWEQMQINAGLLREV